jgi:VanZ family protein
MKKIRKSPESFESPASRLERRITNALLWFSFVSGLALFSTMLFSHGNTFGIIEPIVRLFAPQLSSHDLTIAHNVSRKMGHFLIPALGFWVLIPGPLRDRPITALVACIVFACVDEAFQTFSPGRSGSILDVILDTLGALFGYFVYGAISRLRSTQPEPIRSRSLLRLHSR